MISIGEIYAHKDVPGVYVRVDEVHEAHSLFSVWEVERPGWQSGAGASMEDFANIYTDGPYPESYVYATTAYAINQIKEADTFDGDEQYPVTLSLSHWIALEAAALDAARVSGLRLGISLEESDRIARTAAEAIRKGIERWAWREKDAREEEAQQAHAYGRMLMAPLSEETVLALRQRLVEGTLPTTRVKPRPYRERWRRYWEAIGPEERELAVKALGEYSDEPVASDDRYGPFPSYRCFVERHADCNHGGPEQGCTCSCHGGTDAAPH